MADERVWITSVTDGSGATLGYGYDRRGLPTELVYPNSLAVQRVLRQPGGLHRECGSAVGLPGQYLDAETGLYQLRAHYYDPGTGQFLSVDPMVGGTGEPYAYAANNPLNYIDPLGLFGISSITGAVGGAWDATGGRAVSAVASVERQDIANFSGGVLNTITFGNERRITSALGIDDRVRRGSGAYTTGQVAAIAVPTGGVARAAWRAGRGLRMGNNLRIAPLGNRTGHSLGRWPHYHRRSVDPSTGLTRPGQGIGRHRPWGTKSTDTCFWDRF